MNKKLLIGLIIILVLATLLVGCGSTTDTTNTINSSNPDNLSDEDAIIVDLDQELISEDDNINIGEMI